MSGPDEATTRARVAASEQLPEEPDGGRVAFGFDGYVDRVREMVADRQDAVNYDPIPTLEALNDRLSASVAEGSSLTFEWVGHGVRMGGHTCHLARAFGRFGFDPAMVGTYGQPVREEFREEFGDFDIESIGTPGETDAVEFDDGKLMFSEVGDTVTVDWSTLRDTVGVDGLAAYVDGGRLLGVGYWSEAPGLPDVLNGLGRELWPELDDPPRHVLVDPGDVRKLDAETLVADSGAVTDLGEVAEVTLSANRSETRVFAEALTDATDPDFETAVELSRDALGIDRFVGHGIDRSVVATPSTTASVAVPVVDDPVLTTSSGDHFNAGLALALVEGLDEEACVLTGNAVAGYFVRNGEPPTYEQLRTFVDEYGSYF